LSTSQSLTTERDHQIKVQFAWQRGQVPLAGGLTETGSPVDSKGNAPGNETSGTWVRVAEALAGANWGTNFTPRIGSEVVVDFIEGDMDRPLVIAQLYNQRPTTLLCRCRFWRESRWLPVRHA
jgi:type VI secretion system secreted protein VgrG